MCAPASGPASHLAPQPEPLSAPWALPRRQPAPTCRARSSGSSPTIPAPRERSSRSAGRRRAVCSPSCPLGQLRESRIPSSRVPPHGAKRVRHLPMGGWGTVCPDTATPPYISFSLSLSLPRPAPLFLSEYKFSETLESKLEALCVLISKYFGVYFLKSRTFSYITTM